MNDLQIFNYENSQVRTVSRDGEPWFVLKDVAKVLEIENHKEIANRLDADEVGRFEFPHPQSVGKTIEMVCVNEPGLYTILIRSDKPKAKPFRRWVTHEVLPSIRKTGAYIPEERITAAPLPPESAGGVARLLTFIRSTMKDNKQSPEVISQTVKGLCEQFGIMLPDNFVRASPFEQLSLPIPKE